MSFKSDYFANNIREVSLLSNPNIKVKIRRIAYRTIVLELNQTGIITNSELTRMVNNSTNNELTKKPEISDIEHNIAIGNLTLQKGMVYPKISLEPIDDDNNDDIIYVQDLCDEDFYFLIQEITGFGKEAQQKLQNFQQTGDAPPAR